MLALLGAIVILGEAARAQGFTQGCGNVPAHVCAGLETQAQHDARKLRDAKDTATTRRIENGYNTREAAKKSEALSHIEDEDVQNFPNMDVAASITIDKPAYLSSANETACNDTLWIWGNMLQWEWFCANRYGLGLPRYIDMHIPGDGRIKECLHKYSEAQAVRIVDAGKESFNRNTTIGYGGQTDIEAENRRRFSCHSARHITLNAQLRSYDFAPSDWVYPW